MWHNYAKLYASGWEGSRICSIVLSPNDYQIAKKDPILSKYVISKQTLEDGKRLDIESLKNSKALVVYSASKEDCNYILSWLCNEK